MKLTQKLNARLARRNKGGFSLVELLVVIAVIGILAAIAIPALSNVFENSSKAKAKRNAQNIASTFAAARAAGATVAGSDVAGKTASLISGVNGLGAFASTQFKISSLDSTEISAAAAYLTYDSANDTINYTGASAN